MAVTHAPRSTLTPAPRNTIWFGTRGPELDCTCALGCHQLTSRADPAAPTAGRGPFDASAVEPELEAKQHRNSIHSRRCRPQVEVRVANRWWSRSDGVGSSRSAAVKIRINAVQPQIDRCPAQLASVTSTNIPLRGDRGAPRRRTSVARQARKASRNLIPRYSMNTMVTPRSRE